jgi:hypothetical protein
MACNCNNIDFVTKQEPTCTEPGIKAAVCLDCGEPYNSVEEEIPALGHDYSLNPCVCSRCGERSPTCCTSVTYSSGGGMHQMFCADCGIIIGEQGCDYVNGVCVCGDTQNTEVSQGLEFTSNGDGTCYVSGYTGTDVEVIIPERSPSGDIVVELGQRCFQYKHDITKVTMPDTVVSINTYAFESCSSLTEVVCSASLKYIGGYAFQYCSSLTTITLPQGLEQIGYVSFGQCTSLKSLIIPDSVTSILGQAFQGSGLTSIELPSSVSRVEDSTFINCYDLKTAVINQGTTYLGKNAFQSCHNLDNITIPKSITTIGQGAFMECIRLAYIYYVGTEDEWNKIHLGPEIFWNTGKDTERGTYTLIYLGDESDTLIVPNKLFENAYGNLTLITENTQTDKNIAVHMSYLDVVKLNNPSNIKSGKTLFGITGTNTGSEPDKQAAVVIHDGYNTNIYPFYGNNSYLQNITWSVNSDKIAFSDGQVHTFISDIDALGISTQGVYVLDDNGLSVGDSGGALVPDQIVEYWVVYKPTKDVKNILMIGNSFCYYYPEELYGIANADGYELNIANLYESGCPVKDHWTWLLSGAENYEFYLTNSKGRQKTSVKTIQGSLDYAKENLGADWDVISLQQHFYPDRALDYNKAFNDTMSYAYNLFDRIHRDHINSSLLWHQTWAYQVGYAVPEYYIGEPKKDTPIPDVETQTTTYNNIKTVSQQVAKKNNVCIVPSGDAWQIARADARVGDTLCARLGNNGDKGDYYHDGDIGGGQYLNACVWYEVLMGESCVGNTWRPSNYELSEEKIAALQEAAHEAVAAVYGPGYCVNLDKAEVLDYADIFTALDISEYIGQTWSTITGALGESVHWADGYENYISSNGNAICIESVEQATGDYSFGPYLKDPDGNQVYLQDMVKPGKYYFE